MHQGHHPFWNLNLLISILQRLLPAPQSPLSTKGDIREGIMCWHQTFVVEHCSNKESGHHFFIVSCLWAFTNYDSLLKLCNRLCHLFCLSLGHWSCVTGQYNTWGRGSWSVMMISNTRRWHMWRWECSSQVKVIVTVLSMLNAKFWRWWLVVEG